MSAADISAVDLWLALLVPLGIWGVVLVFVLAGLLAISDGLRRLRRLHQIPCFSCRYYTGSPHLKCPVRPLEAASEAALHCTDYAAAPQRPRPTRSKPWSWRRGA